MRKTGKRELLLAALILLAAALLWLLKAKPSNAPAAVLEISVDGNLAETLDLNQDQEITIPGFHGGSNRLIIQDGQAWVQEASCPDHLCIRQGKISREGEMIVCLPNRMIAEVKGHPAS